MYNYVVNFAEFCTTRARWQEYPVSSLLGGLSREQTRSILFTRERSGPAPFDLRASQDVVRTAMSENQASTVHEKFDELQQQYEELQEKHQQL